VTSAHAADRASCQADSGARRPNRHGAWITAKEADRRSLWNLEEHKRRSGVSPISHDPTLKDALIPIVALTRGFPLAPFD
jgi:uncharacterized protein YdeI (YjbR/CyaY-like superfamily)